MKEILFFKEGNVEYPSFFFGCIYLQMAGKNSGLLSQITRNNKFYFCDDEYILSVNRQYLKHDYYTDVITFDYVEGNVLSGDVFISLDTVRSNSMMFATTIENEFYRVLCHSVLHLIGFKDKTDADSKEMRLNENICLDLLKIA